MKLFHKKRQVLAGFLIPALVMIVMWLYLFATLPQLPLWAQPRKMHLVLYLAVVVGAFNTLPFLAYASFAKGLEQKQTLDGEHKRRVKIGLSLATFFLYGSNLFLHATSWLGVLTADRLDPQFAFIYLFIVLLSIAAIYTGYVIGWLLGVMADFIVPCT
jgi:hypothetical protein